MDLFVGFLITILASLCAGIVAYLGVSHILVLNKDVFFTNLNKDRFSHFADFAFWGLALLYVLVFGALSILRHLAFNTGGFDLGIFDQAIWNSLQGRILQVSIVPDVPSLLGQRFSPILLAFVPLYAMWSDPIVLLVIQTLALGGSAIPIYWYARKAIGDPLALALTANYFLSPALQYVNLYEFHEVALTAVLFSFAMFFLLRQAYGGFLVCLGLALLTKEEVAFTLIAFGVFLFLVQHKRRFGVALAVFGVIWGVLLLQVAIPFFRGTGIGTGYYYFGHGSTIAAGTGRYDYLGGSLQEIFLTIVTRPDMVLSTVLTPAKIGYTFQMLVPLVFIPALGLKVAALALPTLSLSLISTLPFQYDISSHYAAPLLPFLGFATILGLQRLLKWSDQIPTAWRNKDSRIDCAARQGVLIVALLVAGGLSYYFQSPGPLAQHFNPEKFGVTAHTVLGNDLMRLIPTDATVVAQAELQAHLAERQRLYEIPQVGDYRQVEYVAADRTRLYYDVHRAFWEHYRAAGYFETIVDQDGFWIAKRRSPTHALNILFGNEMTLIGYTLVTTDTLPWGSTLTPVVDWRAEKPMTEAYRIVINVVDAQGHVWATEEREPVLGLTPTNRWQVGRPVGDQYTLRLPPTMPTGDYQIIVAVRKPDSGDYLEARDANGKVLGEEAGMAVVRVEKNKKSYTASDLHLLTTQLVDMGEMRFLGYIPPRSTLAPGDLFQVGVYWRAREKPRGDYVVVLQLRDASGSVVFEQGSRPAKDTYPTTQWDAGEVLLDWHDVELPRDLAPGTYRIGVVLRDAASNAPLGQVLLSSISVVK